MDKEMKDNKSEGSGKKGQSIQNGEDEKGRKSVLEYSLNELKEKPISLSIVILTFLSGIVYSVFKLATYIQHQHFASFFHISSKLIAQEMSTTTLITLVAFVMVSFGVALFLCIRMYIRRMSYILMLYAFICAAYSGLCLFIVREISAIQLIKSPVVTIVCVIFISILFILFIKDYWIDQRREYRQKTKNKEKSGHEKISYKEFWTWTGVLLFIFFCFVVTSMINSDERRFLCQLDGSVVVYEEKQYAVIYKTDDYIIGEVIEEKEKDGETYYEIDTQRQKLFKSFDFEMKYLGDDARFELKTSNTTNPNATTQNTTIPTTSALITTTPDITAANTTDHNP